MNNPEITDEFDYLVLVKAPEKARIERVMTRNSLTAQEVRDRMSVQKTGADDLDFDYTLINDSTIEDLDNKARQLYREIIRNQPDARRS